MSKMTNKTRVIDIKRFCEEKGIRIEQCASDTGISFSTLYRFMKNADGIKHDNVITLREYFNLKDHISLFTYVD